MGYVIKSIFLSKLKVVRGHPHGMVQLKGRLFISLKSDQKQMKCKLSPILIASLMKYLKTSLSIQRVGGVLIHNFQ